MIRVAWPTTRMDVKAQVWRVLDLSGLTRSVRESRNFTRAGYVFLDGHRVAGLRDTVSLGKPFQLEIRFPNGRTKSEEIMLVPRDRTVELRPRNTQPTELKYKG